VLERIIDGFSSTLGTGLLHMHNPNHWTGLVDLVAVHIWATDCQSTLGGFVNMFIFVYNTSGVKESRDKLKKSF